MEEDIHRYHGAEIEVSYDANRCIHVRECVENLPGVFDPDRRPWIDADGADADETASVIERCPTGALQYDRGDEGPAEEVPGRNTVTVAKGGPLYLRGDIELRVPDGETILDDTRVGLCRCGHSENKPLCDNSHQRVFDADGLEGADVVVTDDTVDDLEASTDQDGESSGQLIVTLTENGPLQLEGPFALRQADGEATAHESGFLCRCGASDNKPFCDGSHSSVGFSNEKGE
jgi:CDGSH-type Zn-finger protein/uncharacterized Fe-S cluster protein YjdI